MCPPPSPLVIFGALVTFEIVALVGLETAVPRLFLAPDGTAEPLDCVAGGDGDGPLLVGD